jgi:hypothetical protein
VSEAEREPGPPARRRSLWGWGFADRFPDEAARRGLAQLVRVLLPHSQPEEIGRAHV